MTKPERTARQQQIRRAVLWTYAFVGLSAFAMVLLLSGRYWWVLLLLSVTLFVLGMRGLERLLGVELRRHDSQAI